MRRFQQRFRRVSTCFNHTKKEDEPWHTMTMTGMVSETQKISECRQIWLPICETYVQCTVRFWVAQFHTDLFSYFSFWGFEREASNAAVDASVVQRLGKMASKAWLIFWFSCLESNKLVNPIRRDCFFLCNSNQCVFRPWCLSSFYWCFCNSDVFIATVPRCFFTTVLTAVFCNSPFFLQRFAGSTGGSRW